MTTVFTACLGPDSPMVRSPEERDPKAIYLCFSDRPIDVPPYEWVPVLPSDTPRLDSRRIKILADHPRLLASDVTLWHDASYRLLTVPRWAAYVLRRTPADVVAMRHPRRQRIEEEAAAIARWGYLTLEEALAHVARYRRMGFEGTAGLTSNGLLARRVSVKNTECNRLWWAEAQLWGGRDQACFDFCAWATEVRVSYVPGSVRQNRYAAFREPIEEAVTVA
jgi:hypothetical protein